MSQARCLQRGESDGQGLLLRLGARLASMNQGVGVWLQVQLGRRRPHCDSPKEELPPQHGTLRADRLLTIELATFWAPVRARKLGIAVAAGGVHPES